MNTERSEANTFDHLLMAEDSDWFAWPGHMSQAKALRIFLDEGDTYTCSLLEDIPGSECATCGGDGWREMKSEGLCPTCKGSGWTTEPIAFLRSLAREIRAGWVRPAQEGDNVPHLDGWYIECEATDPKAEPAMIWKW